MKPNTDKKTKKWVRKAPGLFEQLRNPPLPYSGITIEQLLEYEKQLADEIANESQRNRDGAREIK